jgi:YQGE family putative transporter
MSAEMRRLLVMNLVCFIVFVYINIFVNLYLWEKDKSIFDVAWFNLIQFITWSFAFTLAGYLLAKYTIRLLISISALAGGTAFIILSFVHLEERLLWIALIAIPIGIMSSFFYAALNLSISLSGKSSEFGDFFATSAIIMQVVSLVIPLLSALVIDWFGYVSTFILMLGFITFLFIYSFSLPAISLKEHMDFKEKSFVRRMFKDKIFEQKGIQWIVYSCLAAGVFLQFQNVFTLIFTFQVTENTYLIAGLNVLYTLIALLGLLLYRKVKLTDNRWLLLGVILLTTGFLIVFIPSKTTLILSNVLTAIGMFFFMAIWNAQQFYLIRGLSLARQAIFLIWRDILLCLTRSLTLLFTLSVDATSGGLFAILVGITVVSLMAVPYFQYRAGKAFEEEERITIQATSEVTPV